MLIYQYSAFKGEGSGRNSDEFGLCLVLVFLGMKRIREEANS